MEIKLTAIIAIFYLLIPPAAGFAQQAASSAQEQWQLIESRFCSILCHPDADIQKINKKINISFYDLSCPPKLLRQGSAEERLAKKIDCLLVNVQTVLDMYPRKMHLTIKIFPEQKDLDRAYTQTFGQPNQPKRISYYVHQQATIYTTQKVISQGLLAHEISHAVCDHYFLILPPEKIKELLAQYAEMQLQN